MAAAIIPVYRQMDMMKLISTFCTRRNVPKITDENTEIPVIEN